VYLPSTAPAIPSPRAASDDTATGSVFVSLDLPHAGGTTSKVIGEFDIEALTTSNIRLGAVIPAEYRSTAATFTVSATIYSSTEATVILDEFDLTHGVLSGDIASFDLRHLGEGRYVGSASSFSILSYEPVSDVDTGGGALATLNFTSSQSSIFDYELGGENAGTLIYPQAFGGDTFSSSGSFFFGAPLGDNIPGDIDDVAPGYQGFLRFHYSVDGGAAESFLVYVADGFTANPRTKTDVGGTFFNHAPDGTVLPSSGLELDFRVSQRLLYRGFDPATPQELVDAFHGITGFQPDATNLVDPLIDHAETPGWTLFGGTNQSTWSAEILGSGGLENHVLDSHDGSGNSNFGPLFSPIDDAVTPADDFFLNPYEALDAAVEAGVDAYGFFKELTVNTVDYVVAKTDPALDATQAVYDKVVGLVYGA
ncbi:MAG: hypothetical protein P8J87_19150, partial [Verrucomicrobiales bacterium]|nr:hypothetical protein [Verrucomicrobiales bacterium]